MVNTNALKAAIANKGFRQSDVAKKIGVSPQSLNSKLLNKVEFRVDEASKLCALLDIPPEKAGEIFFTQKVDL